MKERHKVILKAVIDSYIDTGEPVSSKLLTGHTDLNVSSATIRNDLAELETLGYLHQPHTSAGRVPSEMGYRFYVDNLLELPSIEVEQAREITMALGSINSNVDEFLKQALTMFSTITGYTSAAILPHGRNDKIMKLEVIKTSDDMINLVVITKSGKVKNSFARLYFLATDEDIKDLNRLLGEYLDETGLSQLDEEEFEKLERKLGQKQKEWEFLAGIVKQIVHEVSDPKVIVSGQRHILSYPEFYEIHKAQNVMSFLSEEAALYDVLTAGDGVKIGTEIGRSSLDDMGLVVRKYGADNGAFGALSIFGPKRMDYGKSISQVEYFVKCIEKFLAEHDL